MSESDASDDANAVQPSADAKPAFTFADLGISPELLRAIEDSGYTTPTPIQEKAIPKVLEGRDVLGIAQTGTGKTASFTVPMIEILSRGRARARMPRTLILEPTRELAAQVAEAFDKYGKYHKLTKALLIGGVSFGDQDALLSQGVDVLIATPGRLLDHFERGKLLLSGVQVMVVDEADRMLDMGFIPDIERIFKLTPFTRQTLFFSATMPPEITRITQQFLQSPVRIEVSKPASTAIGIALKAVTLPGGDPRTRRAALRAVLETSGYKNGIIFCNRKTEVDIVAKSLQRTATTPPRFTAIWISARACRRWTGSRLAISNSSSPATSRRAAWTFLTSATCSITNHPAMPKISSIASAAPGARANWAKPSRSPRRPITNPSLRSKS